MICSFENKNWGVEFVAKRPVGIIDDFVKLFPKFSDEC